MDSKKVVIVFGSFDGLHDGHRYFLREARKLGDRLIAVVAQDAYIQEYKGRDPRLSLQERIDALEADGFVDEAVPGDAIQNSWEVLNSLRPQVVALGYDQAALSKALKKKTFDPSTEIVQIPAFKPDSLHSSMLFK